MQIAIWAASKEPWGAKYYIYIHCGAIMFQGVFCGMGGGVYLIYQPFCFNAIYTSIHFSRCDLEY